MKAVSSIIVSLFLTTAAVAQTTVNVSSEQDSPVAAVKSSPDGSMFEIIGRADTDHIILHLNKETGEVKFLGNDKYIRIIRQESSGDVAEAGKVNYQIVMSSSTVYLMNINTGVTWYLKSTGLSHLNDKFVLVTEKK